MQVFQPNNLSIVNLHLPYQLMHWRKRRRTLPCRKCYLPEEMRNPETFKWMMQNPQFQQQMNNMGGNNEWDNRLTDSLKNFNLNSPEIKQQFEHIGLTPEEAISKIMANPDVAMAFQNPKVQAAILDCFQNPLSIAKYQNDKEVMDVFTKISELIQGSEETRNFVGCRNDDEAAKLMQHRLVH